MTYGMETAFFRYTQKDNLDAKKVYATTLISILSTAFIFLIVGYIFNDKIAFG
jgi:hypothetical protein